MEDKRIDLAIDIAMRFLGKPYIWGGNDPMESFDCSGFVIEVLKSVGVLPRSGDWTAHGLWWKFEKVDEPLKGCLIFWEGNMGRIAHVEMCIDPPDLSIGASGGGSSTLTVADAIRQDAYVKIRPWKTRGGITRFANPFR